MRLACVAVVVVFALVVAQGVAWGDTILTTGAGAAVTTADLTADFDLLADDVDLAAYSEGGLLISATGTSYYGGQFPTHYFYENGGGQYWVTISGVGDAVFSGVEFTVGTGWGGDTTRITWSTYLDGSLVGSGSSILTSLSVVGFSNVAGFDELRVIADDNQRNGPTLEFGEYQTIGFDNLRAEIAQPVAEPTTLALLGLGLLGLARRRRCS